jgi:hypothetical protein
MNSLVGNQMEVTSSARATFILWLTDGHRPLREVIIDNKCDQPRTYLPLHGIPVLVQCNYIVLVCTFPTGVKLNAKQKVARCHGSHPVAISLRVCTRTSLVPPSISVARSTRYPRYVEVLA